jgi:23S rRNA (cytidine1920-2'-O)/16S rRNA (cytidine1409-2'-O)-methyltransferase
MLRLDQAMVDQSLSESREKAKRAILAGSVRVNGQVVSKAGHTVKPADIITVSAGEKYVSRGGQKLEHGIKTLGVAVEGCHALDVGASTGGFTDCLLQHGCAQVYAIDVGQGQLAWKLRQDSRVVVMEKTNARDLTFARFPTGFSGADLAVIDCSFISLRKILPTVVNLLLPRAKIVALIKPQFEAGKAEADKGAGVIRDPAVHERVLRELETFVSTLAGCVWCQTTESPILGPAGNKEFLVLIEKCC